MRATINRDLGYTRADRNLASERIAHVARLLNDCGVLCVVSNISQDKEIRKKVREIIERFHLVYVSTPFEVCAERDSKGQYEKAINGELENFVGVDEKYEPPLDAEVTVDASSCSPDEAAEKVLAHLAGRGYVS